MTSRADLIATVRRRPGFSKGSARRGSITAAVFLIVTRLVFDLTSAAAHVYPELDFGQNGIAFVVFILALPGVLALALVRLFQKRFVEAIGLAIICYFPFSFDEAVDRQFWKFRIHESQYQSIMQVDPGRRQLPFIVSQNDSGISNLCSTLTDKPNSTTRIFKVRAKTIVDRFGKSTPRETRYGFQKISIQLPLSRLEGPCPIF
jgi:hypothetical protein